MSRKMGRPPSDNPKIENLHIRVTPDEKKHILKVSEQTGLTILEIIRLGIEVATKK